MKFGYARVSTYDQNLDLQIDAISEYGVDEIFQEKASGKKVSRDRLNELIKNLRKGDTLVIWRLDRLGRTVKQLIELAEYFDKKEVKLVSLKENFDTSTPAGKFAFHLFCAMAQMERDVIAERTKSGLEAARKRGRYGGRKPIDRKNIETALKMYESNNFSVNEILVATGISKSTLYKYIHKSKE